jgi:adsorption protein B
MLAGWLVAWHLLLGEALLITALAFLMFGLDDLFIDLTFFIRTLWRRLVIYTRHTPADAQSLAASALAHGRVGRIAILVPAWDESAVIETMLRHLTATLAYPDYRVFVGVYPNDPAGQAAVARVADPRLQLVRCARPGPTSKADCLNQLWAALCRFEGRSGRPFKAIVLHDAEDVVHAEELWVYNALIPKLAMVQLPVRPLPDPGSPWVSGHYLDEFAEAHAKDLVVREALGAAVPSAGVASGICRTMLGRIAATRALAGHSEGPFDANSLTEDYELGHRIKAHGGRAGLVRLKSRGERLVIATREHFPATLSAAIAQKSRWLAGIALAGWDRIGWPGGLADRYMLLRDRKSIITALLSVIGYGLLLLVGLDAILRLLLPQAAALPGLAPPGSLLAGLLLANLVLFGWRLLMRAGFTAHAHGLAEGLHAVPRTLTSNLINAASAFVAVRRYRQMRALTTLPGAPPPWGKTVHRFPA